MPTYANYCPHEIQCTFIPGKGVVLNRVSMYQLRWSKVSPTISRALLRRAQNKEKSSKAVVLSKRLPEDFIENTLMPHLESQLLYNIHVYTPAELTQIARAYSNSAKFRNSKLPKSAVECGRHCLGICVTSVSTWSGQIEPLLRDQQVYRKNWSSICSHCKRSRQSNFNIFQSISLKLVAGPLQGKQDVRQLALCRNLVLARLM